MNPNSSHPISLDSWISQFEELDQDIQAHQSLYKNIIHVNTEITSTNQEILNLVNRLNSIKQTLEELNLNEKNRMSLLDLAENKAMDLKDLVKYSKRISKHTLSNANGPMEPPIPQESLMRSSCLFQQDSLFASSLTCTDNNQDVIMESKHLIQDEETLKLLQMHSSLQMQQGQDESESVDNLLDLDL